MDRNSVMERSNPILIHHSRDSHVRRRRLSDEAIKSERTEMRGVIILIVCGLYAVSMFILAKILSSLFSSLLLSVKSMFLTVRMEETNGLTLLNENQQLEDVASYTRARPVSHG